MKCRVFFKHVSFYKFKFDKYEIKRLKVFFEYQILGGMYHRVKYSRTKIERNRCELDSNGKINK